MSFVISQKVMELIFSALKNPLSQLEDNTEQKVAQISDTLMIEFSCGAVKVNSLMLFPVIIRVAGGGSSSMCHQCGPPGGSGLPTPHI